MTGALADLELGVGCEPCADGKSLRVVAFKQEGRAERARCFSTGDQWLRMKVGDDVWVDAAEVIEAQRTGKCSFDAVITVEILRDGEPLILTIPAPDNVASEPLEATSSATEPTLEDLVANSYASLPADTPRVVANLAPELTRAPVAATVEATSLPTATSSGVTPSEAMPASEMPWERGPAEWDRYQRWRRDHLNEPGNALGPGAASAVTDYRPLRRMTMSRFLAVLIFCCALSSVSQGQFNNCGPGFCNVGGATMPPGLCSGTSSFLNVDGTDNSISAGTSSVTAGQVNLMSTDEGFAPMKGNFFEAGFWNTTGFTSAQRGQLCHNQYTYWGTSTSC